MTLGTSSIGESHQAGTLGRKKTLLVPVARVLAKNAVAVLQLAGPCFAGVFKFSQAESGRVRRYSNFHGLDGVGAGRDQISRVGS